MKIVLIGAGNVGYHLGLRLFEKGENIVQVFSRKKEKAAFLAKKINSKYTTSLSQVNKKADLYILAVHDEAIEFVAKELVENGMDDKLMVHTSGATSQSVFSSVGAKNFGIFYPLQTFSIDRKPSFSKIPICIEASNKKDLSILKKLAKKISKSVYHINDENRAVLHVAAVFVNNFSNHLYYIGSEIAKENNLPFEILLPLISETVKKLEYGSPEKMQTGPAKRGDNLTIKNHLKFLKGNTEFKELYKLMTKGIKNQKKQS